MSDFTEDTLESLKEGLLNADPELRMQIAHELGRRGRAGSLEVIPVLVQLLDDSGAYVGEAASDGLVTVGEPVVLPLIDLLLDGVESVGKRQRAARSLMYLGTGRGVGPMIGIVRDPAADVQVRRVVALYLGRTRGGEAFEALAAVVTDGSEDTELRCLAAGALGELRDPRAFDPLVSVLQSEDVRYWPAEMVDQLLQTRALLPEASGMAAEHLAQGMIGLERGKSLHDCILDALRSLHDPRTLDLLLPMLGSLDEDHVIGAAAALGSLDDVSMAPLLELLHSGDARARKAAATALGFSSSAGIGGPLTDAMLHDEDTEVRAAAANSLGFVQDGAALDVLIQGLQDDNPNVRRNAADALGTQAYAGRVNVAVPLALREAVDQDVGIADGPRPVRDAAASALEIVERELGRRGSAP